MVGQPQRKGPAVPQGGDYDVFFSYHRGDPDDPQRRGNLDLARPLVEALRAEGLEVFFDAAEIDDFESITRRLTDGVARSKALVALYSELYPRRRACQFELTAAFLAAQRAGDPSERVLVVNPEKEAGHIEPAVLRDALFRRAPAPSDSDALASLAESVAARVGALEGVLGDIQVLTAPSWYGLRAVGSTRFVGRLPAMWEIHSTLHAGELRPMTGASGPGVAQVRGMGGIGKTLLAEEYALRFGAAYPGGVFWLRAEGGSDSESDTSAAEREAARAGQVRAVAQDMGVPPEALSQPQDVEPALQAALERRGYPFLWVVDDLPRGLEADVFRSWLAPHPLGKTLLTTRSREYGALAAAIDPGLLSEEEAYELLTTSRKPVGEAEEADVRGLAEDLGYHALAVDVAAAALRSAGQNPFATWRARLAEPGRDALEFAAQLADALPTGHEPSIAATMLESIDSLAGEGKDLLRLASVLAPAPIPASLVEGVFAAVDELEESEARDRADLARAQVDDSSLAELSAEGAATVHSLVSRSVRFREGAAPGRRDELRAAAIDVLTVELAAIVDARAHAELESGVAHARELTCDVNEALGTELLGWVARYDYERGDLAGARELEERVVAARGRLLGEEHPDTLTAMNNLAETLRAQGDRAGARELHERVLEARGRLLGDEHPATLLSMHNLASTLKAQGDLAGARELQEQVLEARGRLLGEEHPDTLTAMNNLAETLWAQGDGAGARELHERVLAVRSSVLGEEHPHTLLSMNNLAATLWAQGDLAGARELHERALEARGRLLGDEHPDTLLSMNNLAETLRAQGDLAGARELHERALEARGRLLGEEHPDTLLSMNNLAATLRAQGDVAGAEALQERVLELSGKP
jgi:Tetratricopeptide repeat/TIR domain